MILDSSAVVALLAREPDGPIYAAAMAAADRLRMSTATYVETALVSDHRLDLPRDALDALLAVAGVTLEQFTADHAISAQRAHQRFGRRSGSRARLNLGDCFSYALAMAEGEPLLFKGEDFTHTDVRDAARELGLR